MRSKLARLLERFSNDADARRFVRFLFVGGLNTAFSYLVFVAFVYVGLHYSIAGLISTVAGVTFNFFTTGRLVFGSIEPRKMVRFVGVYGALYAVATAEIALGEALGFTPYVTAAAMLLPNALLGYVLNKHLVFRPTEAQP